MARLINVVEDQILSCIVTTKFNDGSTSARVFKVGDIVEDLRYVKDHAVEVVTGRVTDLNTVASKVTKVDLRNPVDYFSTDVVINSVVIDASQEYSSNIVTVPAMEIVEDAGVYDVDRMFVTSSVEVTLEMEYTDGSTVYQSLSIGDILTNMKIMNGPGKEDITGDYRIAAFVYTIANNKASITGLYLVPIGGTVAIMALFENIISFTEVPHATVDDPTSLAAITEALNTSETGEVYAQLGVDVTIPKREDGKITSTFINEGQTLNLDLNGHSIDCQAFAFYVNGGVLNISDSTGNGAIKCHIPNKAYPAVQVVTGGVCNMDSGLIDTTDTEITAETDVNWIYGVVCSGDGVFNMTGGEMKIGGAAGISITNGTATGEGAKFTIGGDAVITSTDCASVYLADNKSVVIKDNAVLNSGIVARMGNITVQDNAVVNSISDPSKVFNLGVQACTSGVEAPAAAILGLTGVYRSDLGNDMNVVVKDNAVLNGTVDDAIDMALVNTKYDQKVTVTVEKDENLNGAVNASRVYTHDELAALAAEGGKTLGAETNATDLKITIAGRIVYPVLDGE